MFSNLEAFYQYEKKVRGGSVAGWMNVRASCVCLCVSYYDRSTGLWGLNGRKGRGYHHPSNSAKVAHRLFSGETQNRGQHEGRSTDAAARMRLELGVCVKYVYPQWRAADIAPSSH